MKTIIVMHDHREGVTSFVAQVEDDMVDKITDDFLIEKLDISFEENEGESIAWEETEPVTLKADSPQIVNVLPYDDDLGVSWKVCLGDKVLDKGFDSTADAEEWAGDNGYAVEQPEELVPWTVPVCRTAHAHRVINVLALNEQDAIEKAIDEAGDFDFGTGEADYSAPDGARISTDH